MKFIALVLLVSISVSCSSFKAERVDNKEADKKGLKITDNWMGEDTRASVKKLIKLMEDHKG